MDKKNRIVYEYKHRDDVLSQGMYDALDYVYSISYPKPEKSFMDMCKDLEKERKEANGDRNWRKTYGDKNQYMWPIDFFYIPREVLESVWKSHKEAYKATNTWREWLDCLSEFLFEKPGFKEVYKETEWSNGQKERTHEDQPLLKDIIGEDNAEKVKQMIDDYRWTYRYDSGDELSWCGGFMSTPNTNRETVEKAWKEAFGKDIVIPDDSAWIDVYDAAEEDYEDEE